MGSAAFPAEEYAGPAVVSPAEAEVSRVANARTSTTGESHAPVVEPDGTTDSVSVDVTLRGHFEPLDGRFHWYGRLAADDALSEWQAGTTVLLTTPHGSATGRLSDIDPWGRFRISGTGRPPF